MSNFYTNEDGQLRYKFEVDFDNTALARHPKKLVILVLGSLSEFIPMAMSDRSYDVQAITGPLWDSSHISHVLLGQIVASIASVPDSPLEADLDSPISRKRYRLAF